MKILWLNWRDIKNPQAGGAEVMTHETAKRLVAAGNKVIIFTAKFPEAKEEEEIDGVKIIRKGNRLTCRFWAYFVYRKEFAGKIDLVIDEINTVPFFTNFYVREKKIALIHQLAREYWWFETFFPLNFLGYILEPFYLKQYRDIPTIAASESTKKNLIKLGFRKVFVFHQGLSVKPMSKPPKKPDFSEILFIGRLTKPKGPQDAILAFKIIHNKIPNTKLIIVGKGRENFVNSLKKLVQKLGLIDFVTFKGFVSETKKIQLLKRAKVILIPSVREGWNLVPIEANAQGTVPVGYKVPGLVDSIIAGQTGILTWKNSPQELAAGAISILANQKLFKKLASGGLAWSQKFSWDRTYESFSEILSKYPKKILWLSWRDIKNPDAGGAEKVAIEAASRFVNHGISVTIFTSNFKGAKEFENIRGVSIIRRGNILSCRLLAFFYYRKHPDFDVIIDEINTIPFFSILYARQKTVVLIHQLAREYWFTQTPWPISLIGYFLEPFILKLYKRRPTIVVSDSTRRDLAELNFKNIKVIREGLDVKPQLRKHKDNLIIFIGRLTKAKGPQDALKAFKQVNNVFPSTKLIIIGKGEAKFTNFLVELAKKLEILNKVEFLGFLPQKDKVAFLKRGKVVLLPSVREGWNLVATEANATGVVPIGYNVSGLKNSIKNGKTGLLVTPTANALAEGTIEIMKNELLRKKIAQAGFRFAKHFSWTNTYSDIKDYLKEIKLLKID